MIKLIKTIAWCRLLVYVCVLKIKIMETVDIRFRFWIASEKRMIYSCGFGIEPLSQIRIWYRIGENILNESFLSEDCIAMQFTGFLDKGLNQIYEGDFIGQGLLRFIVEKRDDGLFFLKHPINAKMPTLTIEDHKVSASLVSGNKYENE